MHTHMCVYMYFLIKKKKTGGFPGGSVIRNLPANQSLAWEDPACLGATKARTTTPELVLQSPGTAATEACML